MTSPSLRTLTEWAFGAEGLVKWQFPLLDDVRSVHGMTVLWSEDDGDALFLVGNHVDDLSDVGLSAVRVFFFPSD